MTCFIVNHFTFFLSRWHVNHSWRKRFKPMYYSQSMKSSVRRQQDAGSVPLRPTWPGTPVTPSSGPVLSRLRDDGRAIQKSVRSSTLPEAEHLIHSSLALLTSSHHRKTKIRWRELLLGPIFGQRGRRRWMTEWSWLALGEKGALPSHDCKSQRREYVQLVFLWV